MTMRRKRRGGKKSSASKKELRQVTLAGQPRKGSTTSSHPTPINSSASRKYERPSEFCRSASIFSKSGTATPNFLAGYRRSNDELTNKLSTLGTQLPGDDFASGNGALSQEIMTNSSKRHNFERGWKTKVRNDHAGHEAHNTSPLLLTSFTPSRPVMFTGGGFFSSNNYSQFTPNPVPTAATTYTVTITTSPASVSAQKWEQHYKLWVPAPQGGRINLLGTGPTTMHPAAMPGSPFNFFQHDWPRLPTTMGLYSTTVSSITTTPAQGATKAIIDTAKEKVLPVPITKPEETFAPAVVQGVSGDAASNLAHKKP